MAIFKSLLIPLSGDPGLIHSRFSTFSVQSWQRAHMNSRRATSLHPGQFKHNIWARYDRFVFSGDIMYVDTTDIHGTGSLTGFSIPGVDVIPPGGNIDAKVDTKQFTATLMGGYRVIDAAQFTLDALAGTRLWHISNNVKLTGSLGGLSESASYDESFGWVDPLVGLRWLLLIMSSEFVFPPRWATRCLTLITITTVTSTTRALAARLSVRPIGSDRQWFHTAFLKDWYSLCLDSHSFSPP